jgi:lysophospholipase L1-like esterase
VWSSRWVTVAGTGAAAAVTLAAVTLSAVAATSAPAPGVPAQRTPASPAAPAAPASPAAAPAAPAAGQALTGPVVALGDSYTAGEMLPLNFTSQPPGCLRSPRAYPALVASALKATFVDAACSGAGVKEMTGSQRTYLGTNPPQLSALAPDDALVLLTLGGDDIGFLNVLHTCMTLSVTHLGGGSPCKNHYTSAGNDQLAAKVVAETAKMAAVLDAIHARAPQARIVVVGYPDLFPQGGGCWPKVPITNGDVAYLRGIGTQLNAMLAGTATAAGATFVDTYTPTIGHDICQSGAVKYVEGLVPTSLTFSFHPNARGQAAMAAQVLAALGVKA